MDAEVEEDREEWKTDQNGRKGGEKWNLRHIKRKLRAIKKEIKGQLK